GKGRNDHFHRGLGGLAAESALPQELFAAFNDQGQDDKGAARGKGRDQHVLRLADDLPVRERGAAHDQGGQDPEREHQGDGHVRPEIDLEFAQVFQAHGASGARYYGKHPYGGQFGDEVGDQRDRPVEHGEARQQSLFLLNADEPQADGRAEQHHRRDQVVGERVERIRWDKQGQKIDLLGLGDQGGAEEGGGLPDREGQGHDAHRRQCQSPRQDEERAGLYGQHFDLLVVQLPEPRDQRQGNIGQHGHLEQQNEGLPDILERR